jgi:hypothetical protein
MNKIRSEMDMIRRLINHILYVEIRKKIYDLSSEQVYDLICDGIREPVNDIEEHLPGSIKDSLEQEIEELP